MPYRHWFVVLTVDGVESRHGPYPHPKDCRTQVRAAPQERSQRRRDVGLTTTEPLADTAHHTEALVLGQTAVGFASGGQDAWDRGGRSSRS